MAILAPWIDLVTGGPPALAANWPQFVAALDETYGPPVWGPGGAAGALARTGMLSAAQIARVGGPWWTEAAEALLTATFRYLPPPVPDVYLGTLLFLAPAATLMVAGRPAIAVGMERFDPWQAPGAPPPRTLYHPAELEEMLPHEAAHVVRIETLGLPPTPRLLSVADMILLEGTALLFADWFLGRQTLPVFMPAAELARHAVREAECRAHVQAALDQQGLEAFVAFFSAQAPVSGYYVGLSLCREFCARTGLGPPQVVTVPTEVILRVTGMR